MRIIPPETFKVSPWRNGGGTTCELAIAPEGATVAEPFHWRLSRAEVASSGPFSPFPGCDRTLVLLEGSGMDLDLGEGRRVRLDRPLVPFEFSGDTPTLGTLLGGPCKDFNVITRRDRWTHHVEVLRTSAPGHRLPTADLLLVLPLGGPVVLGSRHVPEDHLVLCEPNDGVQVVGSQLAPPTLVVVTLHLRPS